MAVVSTSRTKKRNPRDASPNVGRVPKAAETTPPEPPATQRATRKKMTKRSGGSKQTKTIPTNRCRADEQTVESASPGMPNIGTSTAHANRPLDRVWVDRVRAHRQRQASISAILDQTFGRFAESDPSLWDRRAYLMLVGIVYERLATNETDVSTEELIALAKLLAESRRADNQARGTPVEGPTTERQSGASASDNGRLPDSFGDVVRQIYGTNVPPPNRSDRPPGGIVPQGGSLGKPGTPQSATHATTPPPDNTRSPKRADKPNSVASLVAKGRSFV